jgi:hypothetical protein
LGNIRQYTWVITGHFQGPVCEIDAEKPVNIRIFTATVACQHRTTDCGEGEGGTVTPIARDCLFERSRRLPSLHR